MSPRPSPDGLARRCRAARPLLSALVTVLALVLVGGCGPTISDLPLPGTGVAGDTVELTAEFEEVLNLAQGAVVRVNGVDSGRVQTVTTKDFRAFVTMKVEKDAGIRKKATARLRYTTPLGELFVDVTNPATGAVLGDGGRLDPARTSTAPTVEDTLSSASLLINGGGITQLQTVTTELNKAIGGREGTVRELMAQTTDLLTSANATSADFVAALDAMADLSRTLNRNDDLIDRTLTELRPAAAVLRQETPHLTLLLTQMEEFAGTANRVMAASRGSLLSMMRQMVPILDEFLANRDVLGPSLTALVHASRGLDHIVPGDYANLKLTLGIEQLRLLGVGIPNARTTAEAPAADADIGLGALLGGDR